VPQTSPRPEPKTPLRSLRERWVLAVVLVVVGGAGGAAVGASMPTTYTGEARVAVGSESLDARIVAGYSVAANQLASDISRYVNDAQTQDSVAPLLGDAADDVEHVAASPIPSSSVIRVEVQATTEAAAVAGAQAVAEQLSDQVNAVSGESSDTLLQEYTDLSNRVAAAQQALSDAQGNLASLTAADAAQADLDLARAAATQAASDLDVLQVQQQATSQRYRSAVANTPSAAGLRVVRQGQLAGDDRSSHVQQYGLVGAVVGLFLALLLAVWADRRRARRAAATQVGAVDLSGPGTSGDPSATTDDTSRPSVSQR
jgi:hypothetical protein